ncbi:MAG: methyltransferase [Gemmatimonadaceae bacterium]
MTEYRDWQRVSVNAAGNRYLVATKPGVFSHGHDDPSSTMLVEHAIVEPGGVVVHLNCGNGLFGAAAALGHASRVFLTDRNVVNVEAARRTLIANDAGRAEVILGHGSTSLPQDLSANTIGIRIPKEKGAVRQLLWDAFALLSAGGRCYMAGATNEGIKSAASLMTEVFGHAHAIAHDSGHRILFAKKQSESPPSLNAADIRLVDHDAFNEVQATLRGEPTTLFSRPGVFSWEHLDEATSILSDAIAVAPGESVLDLGCGAGALGIVAARLSGTGMITMLDADVEAVRSATRSAQAANVTNYRVLPSDIAEAVLNERFDVVVTNPPFHVGKATALDVPLQFIRDAWQVLAPGGRLFLVANRTLPYERTIYQRFGNIETVVDGRRFKVLSATK